MRIELAGGSHSAAITARVTLPAGLPLDLLQAQNWLQKRRPNQGLGTSTRNEPDQLHIDGGIKAGLSTGEPLLLRIDNVDARPQDYHNVRRFPRPGQADFTWPEGEATGGARSARLTALHVALAGLLDSWIASHGPVAGAALCQVGELQRNCEGAKALRQLDASPFAQAIEDARLQQDSIGGAVQFDIDGVPFGLGGAWGRDVPSTLAKWLWQIPGVKALELGSGVAAGTMLGSQHNDPLTWKDGATFLSNHAGGVLGGRASGQPITGRVWFKPTPSIPRVQQTVDLQEQCDATIRITGRHDACIAVRGTMVVQAMCNLALAELLLASQGEQQRK